MQLNCNALLTIDRCERQRNIVMENLSKISVLYFKLMLLKFELFTKHVLCFAFFSSILLNTVIYFDTIFTSVFNFKCIFLFRTDISRILCEKENPKSSYIDSIFPFCYSISHFKCHSTYYIYWNQRQISTKIYDWMWHNLI